MANIQTPVAKGYQQVPQPADAGSLHTMRVTLALAAQAIATTDVVELLILPMHCRIRSAVIIPVGIGAGVNANVGIMSGTPGDPDGARTVGTEIFNAQAINATPVESVAATMLDLAPTDTDRSIGLTVSANVAAGAKSITLIVDYWQP
jgi:hypothetical protein